MTFMKILKYLGLLLGLLIAILLAGPLFLPDSFHMERSMVIEAPAPLVFVHVNDVQKMQAWGPWQQMDSTMQVAFGDTTVGEGAYYEWTSTHSGNGTYRIVESRPYEFIKSYMTFEGMGTAEGTWQFEPVDEGTRVTWGLDSRMSYLMKWFGLFLDQLNGPFFELGLNNLKAIAESEAQKMNAMEVRLTELPWTRLLGIRGTDVSMSTISNFYATNFGALAQFLTANGIQPASQPCGIYLDWNEPAGTATLLAAIAVADEVSPGEGMEVLSFEPGTQALLLEYHGPYEGLGLAHGRMDQYMAQNGYVQSGPVIEEYVTDPSAETDSSKWLTRVYYVVSQAAQ